MNNDKIKLVFATNNAHKLRELREILGEGYELLSLADIGCHEDIPEDGATLEENSLAKHSMSSTTMATTALPTTRDWRSMPWVASLESTAHVTPREQTTTARPICANCWPN